MSYNKGYELGIENYNNETGCIDFNKKYWSDWHDKWINKEPDKYYAYLKDESFGNFVGEVSFRYEESKNAHCIGIVIESKYRGKGYCSKGLSLLSEKAFIDLGVDKLRNDIPIDRVAAIGGHKKAGFREICVENGICILELSREYYFMDSFFTFTKIKSFK
jgi:hypothetical protein